MMIPMTDTASSPLFKLPQQGIFLASLCTLFNSVYGVDLNFDPEKNNPCLEKVGVHCNLIQGYIVDDSFEPKSFDRMHALMRPSGKLLVGMPRVYRLMARGFSLIGFDNIYDHHITDYTACKQAAAGKFELSSALFHPLGQSLSASILICFFKKETTGS